jgi:hypothetical protein
MGTGSNTPERSPPATGTRRLRNFYNTWVGAIVVIAALMWLATGIEGLGATILLLGFGSLGVAGLAASAWPEAGGTVRPDGITRHERLIIVWGLVAMTVAALMVFVEAAAGSDGAASLIFAVTLAVSTGLFAVGAILRE